jgi:hypothetical protein
MTRPGPPSASRTPTRRSRTRHQRVSYLQVSRVRCNGDVADGLSYGDGIRLLPSIPKQHFHPWSRADHHCDWRRARANDDGWWRRAGPGRGGVSIVYGHEHACRFGRRGGSRGVVVDRLYFPNAAVARRDVDSISNTVNPKSLLPPFNSVLPAKARVICLWQLTH